MTIDHNAEIDIFIKTLYPSLIIHELKRELSIQSAPAVGICSAHSICYDKVPEKVGIVLTEKIPPKFLGFLPHISGFITREEDPSSHTAIVCRSQGIPIVNVTQSNFEELFQISQHVKEDIAIDTFQEKIFIGKIQLEDRGVISSRQKILKRIKSTTKLDVNANSDTALELKHAVNLGFQHAWPRSETLLYTPSIFSYFVAFLICPSHEYARRQFIEGNIHEIKKLFNEAHGTRVAFRLLDPPSHEFFPALEDTAEIEKISNILGVSKEEICRQIREHVEINPMIGHRGARLLLSNLDLLHAQVFSMFRAWTMADPKLRPPYIEILVPFVMLPSEFKTIKEHILSLQSAQYEWIDIPVKYGCMVEVPSILDYPCELAPEVDFFSFGTNDLVSLMHGISRGDAYHKYLSNYLSKKIMCTDPFSVIPPQIIDKIQTFCLRAKSVNPHITVDICGEQALYTNLSQLLESGALDAVSIGTENLPILVKSLIQSGILAISESV